MAWPTAYASGSTLAGDGVVEIEVGAAAAGAAVHGGGEDCTAAGTAGCTAAGAGTAGCTAAGTAAAVAGRGAGAWRGRRGNRSIPDDNSPDREGVQEGLRAR